MNNCTFMGRFTKDPELKTTTGGTSVCSFSLAVDRRFKDADGNKQADFIDFVAWKGTAEFISKFFKKGDMIAIAGELQTRTYETQDGSKRKVSEVIVNDARFCGGKSNGNAGSDFPAAYGGNDASNFEEIPEDDSLPF